MRPDVFPLKIIKSFKIKSDGLHNTLAEIIIMTEIAEKKIGQASSHREGDSLPEFNSLVFACLFF